MKIPKFIFGTLFKLLGVAILILKVDFVSAGIVEQVDFEAQPYVSLKNGEVDGCGFRLLAAKVNLSKASKPLGIDVSFNVYVNGLGLVKGGLRELDLKSAKDTQAVPIKTFWIKAKNVKATHPVGSVVSKGVNPKNYLIYASDIENLISLFPAVFDKDALMVGYRLVGEDIDRIFNGKVKVEDAEVKQVMECMDELMKNMEKSIK